MRNKLVKILLIVILIVLGAGGIYVLKNNKNIGQQIDNYRKSKTYHIGDEIDNYKNVKVYYNGVNCTKAYGENYSKDGYYFGQKWQCVEYVKRFYYEVENHKMPDVYGNARDFFDPGVKQGGLNKNRGLIQYRNGGNVKPEPDDLIVFTDTKFGHVAIVTKVTSDYIEVIQQNVNLRTRAIYKLVMKNNRYYVGTKRKPAGWLRKK